MLRWQQQHNAKTAPEVVGEAEGQAGITVGETWSNKPSEHNVLLSTQFRSGFDPRTPMLASGNCAAVTGRADDSIRRRAQLNFASCIQRGVHRCVRAASCTLGLHGIYFAPYNACPSSQTVDTCLAHLRQIVAHATFNSLPRSLIKWLPVSHVRQSFG